MSDRFKAGIVGALAFIAGTAILSVVFGGHFVVRCLLIGTGTMLSGLGILLTFCVITDQ